MWIEEILHNVKACALGSILDAAWHYTTRVTTAWNHAAVNMTTMLMILMVFVTHLDRTSLLNKN